MDRDTHSASSDTHTHTHSLTHTHTHSHTHTHTHTLSLSLSLSLSPFLRFFLFACLLISFLPRETSKMAASSLILPSSIHFSLYFFFFFFFCSSHIFSFIFLKFHFIFFFCFLYIPVIFVSLFSCCCILFPIFETAIFLSSSCFHFFVCKVSCIFYWTRTHTDAEVLKRLCGVSSAMGSVCVCVGKFMCSCICLRVRSSMGGYNFGVCVWAIFSVLISFSFLSFSSPIFCMAASLLMLPALHTCALFSNNRNNQQTSSSLLIVAVSLNFLIHALHTYTHFLNNTHAINF